MAAGHWLEGIHSRAGEAWSVAADPAGSPNEMDDTPCIVTQALSLEILGACSAGWPQVEKRIESVTHCWPMGSTGDARTTRNEETINLGAQKHGAAACPR